MDSSKSLTKHLMGSSHPTGHLPAELSRLITADFRSVELKFNCNENLLRKDGVKLRGAVPFFCLHDI